MACDNSSGVTLYNAIGYITDVDGNSYKACCFNQFNLTPVTEVSEQKCDNGTFIKNAAKLTFDATFDLYQIGAGVLPMIFPTGSVESNDGVTPETKSVTVPSGSWSKPDGANTSVLVPYFNADGSSITVDTVAVGETALTAGVEYNIVEVDECVGNKSEKKITKIELVDGTIADDCESLTYEVTYTPSEGNKFTVTTGSYTRTPVSLTIFATDTNDSANTQIVNIPLAYFDPNGAVILSYQSADDDVPAKSITMNIPENVDVTWDNVPTDDVCGISC